MGDGETLLLVLSLLYLSDCLIWVQNRSVAFVSPWRRRWHVAYADSFLGNERGSLLFLNPLPPLGRVFLTHLSPVSISPAGVCAFNPQSLFHLGVGRQSGRTIQFDEIVRVDNDGSNLLINGQKFTNCATAEQARRTADLIHRSIGSTPSDRALLISKFIAQQFDVDEARSLLSKTQNVIKPIQSVCCVLFLLMFVAAPALVIMFGLLQLIIPVGVVLALLAIGISIMFYRGHKLLYGDDSEGRVENLIKMIVCPPVSIRATDVLTKNVLSAYSPVVVANLIFGSTSSAFVRAYVLDLRHPLAYEARGEMSGEIISWAAATHLKLCFDYLNRGEFFTPKALLAPPQQEGDSLSYCPRCRSQFLVSSGPCPDCPGVLLLAFSSSSETRVGGAA